MNSRYLKMIRKMENVGEKCWSVYILRCGDGSLYTGIAKDVTARLAQHAAGKGAAYTRTHPPVSLVYQRTNLTRSEALVEEARLKRLPKAAKEKLVARERPPISE